MKIGKYEIKITDSTTELNDTNEVYASISAEAVKEYFSRDEEIIVNDDGDEDDSYVEGDIQFIFDKEGYLDSILLFPVYKDTEDDAFVNGENFVDITEYVDKETIDEIKNMITK